MSGLCTTSNPSQRYNGGCLDAALIVGLGALSVDVAELDADAVIIVHYHQECHQGFRQDQHDISGQEGSQAEELQVQADQQGTL